MKVVFEASPNCLEKRTGQAGKIQGRKKNTKHRIFFCFVFALQTRL